MELTVDGLEVKFNRVLLRFYVSRSVLCKILGFHTDCKVAKNMNTFS